MPSADGSLGPYHGSGSGGMAMMAASQEPSVLESP